MDNNTTRKDFCATIFKRQPVVVGIHRFIMKLGGDNFRESSVKGGMERIKAKVVEVIVGKLALVISNFWFSCRQ